MAGFDPRRARPGRPFVIRLVNPDSPYHTDGGGWHQLRIERLGVDVRVAPRSSTTQAVAGLAPGTYEFYCKVYHRARRHRRRRRRGSRQH
ncbi:MAG: cupredoxin domain-containing protein [Armatimonadota bacterium]|nr:cupredoxin domain-containing protein [Armatimonadota bacterium]